MPSRRRTIRHLVAGGWATDYGPFADIEIEGSGVIRFPFLWNAENIQYELDGGWRKVGGVAKLNSAAVDDAEQVRGIFDYWKQGSAGSATQKRVIHAGTRVYKDDADGTFTAIITGLNNDTVPSYCTFDDLLIISQTGSDVPKSWDQTTVTDPLAGTPPNFSFATAHKNRLWAAGVDANPSTLYYSANVNPEDWVGAGTGNIAIDPDDGDRITGIISHKDELWVFKGPYKGSIHRIVGSAPTGSDAFARATYIEGLGAVWHNAIFRYRDDIGFMWSDGTIHSLAATAAYGDFRAAALSAPLHSWLRDHLNFNRLRYVWAATDVSRGQVVFVIPTDTSADNNDKILTMDYRFNPVRWALWPSIGGASVANVIDQTAADQPTIMIGGNDGFVRKAYRADRSIDGSSAYTAKVTTPYISYGSPLHLKAITQAGIGIRPRGPGFSFKWTRDDGTQQSQTLVQGGGNLLASNASQTTRFTLSHATLGLLGSANYANRYADLVGGGEFRTISYEFTQAGANQDLEVHDFSTTIELGTESLEN